MPILPIFYENLSNELIYNLLNLQDRTTKDNLRKKKKN